MEQFIKQITNNFLEFFKTLDMVRRIGLVVLSGLIIAIMAAIVIWATKTNYKVLYTDLNKDDASKIVRILEEKRISYQFDDDGKTIKVPDHQVEVFRLEIAKKGVDFSGTVGYEIFDKQSFGTTSFVQRINRERALVGEITKTLLHIHGVRTASVLLNIPENSPFVSEQKSPTAAVTISLEDGVALTAEEIRGISSLVASAVSGMRTENVTIHDSRGKQLTDRHVDRMAQETANRMALEAKYNSGYERQIEEILSKVIGQGKVIAKVAVALDFSEKIESETTFDNEGRAVLSEVTNTQKLQGSRPSPQGLPGARSNLPGETPQPGIPETKNDIDKSVVSKNYNVPHKTVNMKKPTAELQSVSVAVMVDGKYVPLLDKSGAAIVDKEGIPQTQYKPWSEAEVSNFQAIIASTIGLNTNRGDKIVIKNMEFIKEDMAAAEAAMRARENRELMKNMAKYLAICVVICLFFFIVVRPFIQWVTENTIESIEDFLPKTLEELEKLQANQKLPGLEDALPQLEEKINPDKIEGNMLKEKIVTLIEANPSKAAQVLHDMIHTAETDKQIA